MYQEGVRFSQQTESGVFVFVCRLVTDHTADFIPLK